MFWTQKNGLELENRNPVFASGGSLILRYSSAEQKFKEIHGAYFVLSDEVKRREYDEELRSAPKKQPPSYRPPFHPVFCDSNGRNDLWEKTKFKKWGLL